MVTILIADLFIFEYILRGVKNERGIKLDTELDSTDLRKIIEGYKALIRNKTGKTFPREPAQQLRMVVEAIFKLWNNSRAVAYRKLNDIHNLFGTAINIQAMVLEIWAMT